jgi:triphosphatase
MGPDQDRQSGADAGKPAPPHDEFELKLALSPEALERLSQHPLVRTLARGRSSRRRLVSTYYDTPAGILRQQAMALRVRREGRRRTQTLKVKRNGVTGLQHFHEYETPLEHDDPDLARIEDPTLKGLVDSGGLAAEIGPVFTTNFARRKFRLELADSVIELALDSGQIESGDRSLPLCEAELELISGRPARIYELALTLLDSVPFRLEGRTKAGRGYNLAMNDSTTPVFGVKPDLAPEMTAAQAFDVIARTCRDQIQSNAPAVLAANGMTGDPEGVHQMRVGIRRLRAALPVFEPILAPDRAAELKAELGWLQKELGPARDWDVFATQTLPAVQARMPDEACLEALRADAQAARRTAYERAHAAVGERRYARLLLRLNLWLEEGTLLAAPGHAASAAPIGPFACEVLARRDGKVRKLGRKYAKLTPDELHRLRIETKKLRYATEFFRSLFPAKPVKRYLKALVAIQDVLGAMNDADVCRHLLGDLRVRAALGAAYSKPLSERATGLVLGWQAAVLDERMRHLGEAWKTYRKLEPFWADT